MTIFGAFTVSARGGKRGWIGGCERMPMERIVGPIYGAVVRFLELRFGG
jgi:hypothetical protein